MGIGGKPHFNTVSIPSRLLLHPLHLQLPGISKKKNAARKPNKQFSPENWGRVKSIDVILKWSIPLFWFGGNPTILASPANSVLHIWLGHTKIFRIAAPMTRRKPGPGCPGSHQHVFVCVYWCFTQKISHGFQFSQVQVESQISPDRSNECSCPKPGYLFRLPHGREVSGK